MVRSLFLVASAAFVSAAMLCGCGENARKLTAADQKVFESAAPEVKQKWTQAQAAMATNDYAGAILTLRSMLSSGLPKEQTYAVMDALSTYDAKLMKAVNRGDPAAQKALETLRSPAAQMGR